MVTGPGGFSYTQTDPVSGNGTYTAPTGFTCCRLPERWRGPTPGRHYYVGDANNAAATDQGGPAAEQAIVGADQPDAGDDGQPGREYHAGDDSPDPE